ncbi:hypothetical protein CSOJ01_12967 [Colletotrichum sojae]|uniref:Uncharacterized protein n=1 Tax=Colletotrichum sojae TaxID=2175907 RepID=A0A8H6ML58_9PEZI|nr:hypothetical protein CSOJ01_12967 [Colletotrichum sojae]
MDLHAAHNREISAIVAPRVANSPAHVLPSAPSVSLPPPPPPFTSSFTDGQRLTAHSLYSKHAGHLPSRYGLGIQLQMAE